MNPYLFILAKRLAEKRLQGKDIARERRKPLQIEAQKIAVSISFVLKNSLFIVLAVISASFGLKAFLLPSEFIDGGVTGISLLISITNGWPLPVLIILINLPFFILGFSTVSKRFVLKSVVAVILLALALFFIEFPIISEDKLILAFFGGFFVGLGIGLAIRGGAVIDGAEILAIWTSRRTGFSVGDFLTIINVVIFIAAAYFLSIEQALYSIIAYIVASKVADYVVDGVEEYTAAIIVSDKSEEIRQMIVHEMGRATTVLTGKRGYSRPGEITEPIDVLYCVITRLEIAKFRAEAEKIDPKAFITFMTINDTRGGMVKKRTIKD